MQGKSPEPAATTRHRRARRRQSDPADARLAQIMAGEAASLRRASLLSVAGALMWPVQAAAVALAIDALLHPGTPVWLVLLLAAVFVGLGLVRAALERASGGLAFGAADRAIAAERARLLAREAARAAGGPGRAAAAAMASLGAEKLAALAPALTRFGPARARALVIPPLFILLALPVSWAVALVFLIAGPLIPVFMALVGIAAKAASERQMEEMGSLNVLLLDRLSALADIRLLDASERVSAGFADAAESLRARTMEVLRIAFLSSTVLELLAALGVAMVAVYVGFTLLGELSFGAWGAGLGPAGGVFVLLLAPEFFQPLRDLAAAWHDKAEARAVAGELAAREAAPFHAAPGLAEELEAPAPARSPARSPAHSPAHSPARVPLPAAWRLASRGLRAEMPGGAVLTFPDIDLRPGESLALTGPSGSGKTTLLRLLAGLEAPAAGQIRLGDGLILDGETAPAWRAMLGWMPQAPHFIAASLRANLLLGAPGGVATPAALEQALALARAGEVVARLPRGLNAQLGERGVGVSGGEARRLMLARAALGAPALVLADEPTADLDAATAQAVGDGLLALAARGTALIVATHDPALAARMGRVVALDAEAGGAEGAA